MAENRGEGRAVGEAGHAYAGWIRNTVTNVEGKQDRVVGEGEREG